MKFQDKIENLILNNSIKNNLLSLYSIIIVCMSILLAIMLFYSIDLNNTYNKIMLNFDDYTKIYYQINSIDKDIYSNITEQKKFDAEYYNQTINAVNEELTEIGSNIDENKNIADVEILIRTVDTLRKYINEVDLLIKNNASYPDREKLLNDIIHIKEIIKENTQILMEFDLTQSRKHINTIKSGYNIALGIIIILFLISIIASVSFLLFVIKNIIHKINIISDHSNKLANGDLSAEHINFSDSNEFQILALSFNKMRNNITDYIDQLSSSEMRISSILNELNDCVITTNSLGIIESCNNAITKIFNYTRDEVLGHNINEFISGIDFSKYKNNMFNTQKLIENEIIIDNKYQLDGTKKDKTTVPIEVSYNEVEIEGQRVTTFIIHDITQHKNVEKMKDEFISTVSHELRTPLTSIKGSLGLIRSGVLGIFPEKVNNLIDIADNNCSRLTNLINDILDLEKIKIGKMEFNYEELEINKIMEESLLLNQHFAEQFGTKIKVVKLDEESFINVDKNRLLQVISNLISNAVKFSDSGSEVTVILERESDTVKISVMDKGIGIPDDSKNKIFNSFSQVDSSYSRSRGGTGLGLNISKSIIEKMGGKIGFESIIGVGSIFFVTFPITNKTSIIKSDNF